MPEQSHLETRLTRQNQQSHAPEGAPFIARRFTPVTSAPSAPTKTVSKSPTRPSARRRGESCGG